MTQNIPLAIVLVVFGSFCFALSANFQHGAVGTTLSDNRGKNVMGWKALLKTIRSGRWLTGMVLLGVSAALQVTALSMAPVSVVQPVGLLAFPWSILLQSWGNNESVPKRILAAVGVTVLSTFAFTVVSSMYAVPQSNLVMTRVVIGAAVVYLGTTTLGLIGARGPLKWRSLAWASGGALFYGLEAALVKSVIEYMSENDWARSPLFWAIVIALVIGSVTAGWMIQQGYATGPAEIVVGSTTITSPVAAVVFGIAVLGEGRLLTLPAAVAMASFAAIAITGVVTLTHFNHAKEQRQREDEAAAEVKALEASTSGQPYLHVVEYDQDREPEGPRS